jgi:hypothetical protein
VSTLILKDWLFVVAAAFALNEIFAFLRVEKTLNYFSISDILTKQMNPIGFLLYRFAPVLIISLIVATHFRSTPAEAWSVYLVIFSHVATKDLKGFYESSKYRHSLKSIIYLCIALVNLVIVAPLSIYITNHANLNAFKPTSQGVIDNLWAAFIILIVASFFYRMTRTNTNYTDKNIRKSVKRINPGLLQQAYDKSIQKNADPLLVIAVMIYENLQRPPWVRELEKLLSIIPGLSTTSGIMQIQSDKPLSDEKSVSIAIDKHFKDLPFPADYSKKEEILKSYNSDPRYPLDINAIYGELSRIIRYDDGQPQLDKKDVFTLLDNFRGKK